VDGLHEIRGFLLVALEALLCDFGARLEVHVADQVDMAASAAEPNAIPAMRTAAAMKRGTFIRKTLLS
jgi:hypothetical protein